MTKLTREEAIAKAAQVAWRAYEAGDTDIVAEMAHDLMTGEQKPACQQTNEELADYLTACYGYEEHTVVG